MKAVEKSKSYFKFRRHVCIGEELRSLNTEQPRTNIAMPRDSTMTCTHGPGWSKSRMNYRGRVMWLGSNVFQT